MVTLLKRILAGQHKQMHNTIEKKKLPPFDIKNVTLQHTQKGCGQTKRIRLTEVATVDDRQQKRTVRKKLVSTRGMHERGYIRHFDNFFFHPYTSQVSEASVSLILTCRRVGPALVKATTDNTQSVEALHLYCLSSHYHMQQNKKKQRYIRSRGIQHASIYVLST